MKNTTINTIINICVLVAVSFIAAAFVAPQIVAARKKAEELRHPPTIDWIGHPVVSDNNPYTPSQAWLPNYKIGFRSDGVVVWTNLESK
jgi:hypothetical protein